MMTAPSLQVKLCYDDKVTQHDRIIVYLHGFPDLSVNPSTNEFASRFASKMNSDVTQKIPTKNSSIFVCFNFSGCPGSDTIIKFEDKTITQEVQDAKDVIQHVSSRFHCSTVHVIGLSTGAIIGCLLRNKLECVKSITVVASLLNVEEGMKYDFTEEQKNDMETKGYCLKEFYLPIDCRSYASEKVEVTKTSIKTCYRLNKSYLIDALKLNLKSTLQGSQDMPSQPILVIHGEADTNIPIINGKQVYDISDEPKQWVSIPKANHLLSNSKHMKKACQQIVSFINNVESQEN